MADFEGHFGLFFHVTITNVPFFYPSPKLMMRSKVVDSRLFKWKNNHVSMLTYKELMYSFL